MKMKVLLVTLSIITIQPNLAKSGDIVFQNSADEIISQLQKQESSKFGLKRTFNPAYTQKTVEIMKEEGERPKKDTINIYTNDFAAKAKLKIEFDVDSYIIRESSYPLLAELAKAMNSEDLSGKEIQIEGYSDSDGLDTHNLKLSYNRALAIKQFLIANFSIEPEKIKICGFGESLPLVPNTNNYNKQINRRVEVKLYKQ